MGNKKSSPVYNYNNFSSYNVKAGGSKNSPEGFSMGGFSGFGNETSPVTNKTIKYGEKSYTKKDPKKSYMGDKSRSEFGLYKAGIFGDSVSKGKKYSEKDKEAADFATVSTVAGLGGTISSALGPMGGALPGALAAGLTGTAIVIGEGTRRIRKGETRAKDRSASAFSGGKTWSQAKEEGKKKGKIMITS